MEAMTAEQAAEWGKTLDFPTVWAALMETRAYITEVADKVDLTTESVERMADKVDRVSENIGGVNKSFGQLMEEMYSARLWDKFAAFGYDFTCGSRNKKFRENEQSLAEADVFLENGL